MYIKVALILSALLLLSCKQESNDQVGTLCTLVSSEYAIHVQAVSPTPLPPNIAISVNGNNLDLDECVDNELIGSIDLNAGRTEAEAKYHLAREDFDHYFRSGSKEPQSNTAVIGFYTRANCSDPHTKLGDTTVQINWVPTYANGRDCGASGYVGEVEIN